MPTDHEFLAAGPRVTIRLLRPEDQAELIALNHASRALHGDWIAPPTTPDQFAALLERSRRDDVRSVLVCERAGGAIIGVVNLSQIFYGAFQNAYMGYYGGQPTAERGLMTEGVGLVLGYAFETLALHRVEANIQPENTRSIALVRRLGFTREGFSPRYLFIAGAWRDHERWAMLAEDWAARGDASTAE
jgi:[ribosomal protein S5]-alanine N-acetyltransferase